MLFASYPLRRDTHERHVWDSRRVGLPTKPRGLGSREELQERGWVAFGVCFQVYIFFEKKIINPIPANKYTIFIKSIMHGTGTLNHIKGIFMNITLCNELGVFCTHAADYNKEIDVICACFTNWREYTNTFRITLSKVSSLLSCKWDGTGFGNFWYLWTTS